MASFVRRGQQRVPCKVMSAEIHFSFWSFIIIIIPYRSQQPCRGVSDARSCHVPWLPVSGNGFQQFQSIYTLWQWWVSSIEQLGPGPMPRSFVSTRLWACSPGSHWLFTRRTDAEPGAPKLWPLDAKSQLVGRDPDARKDGGQEEKGTTEDEMVGWHHRLNGHEFEQTPGDSAGQGSLAVHGVAESDMAEDRTRANSW